MKKDFAIFYLLFVISLSACTLGGDLESLRPSSDGSVTDGTGMKFYSTEVKNDMFLQNEAFPHGVPKDWDWCIGPVIDHGIKIPQNFNAIMAWGAVRAEESVPAPKVKFPLVRVHLKDLQLYIYYDNDSWKLVQNTRDPFGYLYYEDFENPDYFPATIKKEEGGGISIQAGSGFIFYFGEEKKSSIPDKDHMKGVFVVCKARLIGTENYKGTNKFGYLIGMGADYWRSVNSEWGGEDVNNVGVAHGRIKYVTPKWQYFTMHTFSKQEVENIKFPLD